MNSKPDPVAPTTASSLPAAALPGGGISARLSESLVAEALDAGRDRRPGRARRSDGWTPDRIRTFLAALAECGVVEDAARAAGMTRQSAYRLRNRAAGRAFHLAWNAALQLARRRLADELMSRALHGCVDLIVRDGEVWGERHRHDNRLAMAMLTRLDRQAASADREDEDVRLVAEEYDEFVDLVVAGGDGADLFIGARREADRRFCRSREARLLRRLDRYRQSRSGLPDEAEAADPLIAALLARLAETATAADGDPRPP